MPLNLHGQLPRSFHLRCLPRSRNEQVVLPGAIVLNFCHSSRCLQRLETWRGFLGSPPLDLGQLQVMLLERSGPDHLHRPLPRHLPNGHQLESFLSNLASEIGLGTALLIRIRGTDPGPHCQLETGKGRAIARGAVILVRGQGIGRTSRIFKRTGTEKERDNDEKKIWRWKSG